MVTERQGVPAVDIAEQTTGRYDFAVAASSPYARAVALLDRHGDPGVVIDLGCSFGRVAEVIAERARSYVGIDVDDDALASLRSRGHETARVNLSVAADVTRLSGIVGDRPVGAVFALDVIEHLSDTASFLDQLSELLRQWGDPLLVTSIPNVAHRDLAAKLLAGRWDYTDVGLLDRTHVSLFTERRMLDELGARDLACVGAADIVQPAADQHFPPLHPYLAGGTPGAGLVSWLRAAADPRGDTYQFVRAWRRSPRPPATTAPSPAQLTVIVDSRDGSDVTGGLEDTLVCLGAQDTDDFDVVVPVAEDRFAAVEDVVNSFAAELADRISVLPVDAPSAAGRLNAALGQVTAPLTAFVVAGDVVTATWVRRFLEAAVDHPGAVVRVRSFQRVVDRTDGVTLSQGNAVAVSDDRFDLWRHLTVDQLPLGSFALPTAVCQAGLPFDEDARAARWKFSFTAAMLAGVVDIATIACVHQREAGDDDPTDDDLGVALEQTPVFVPAGWATRLQGDRNHLAYLTNELMASQQQADATMRLYQEISGSRWWRAGAPARRGMAWLEARRRH